MAEKKSAGGRWIDTEQYCRQQRDAATAEQAEGKKMDELDDDGKQQKSGKMQGKCREPEPTMQQKKLQLHQGPVKAVLADRCPPAAGMKKADDIGITHDGTMNELRVILHGEQVAESAAEREIRGERQQEKKNMG